MDISTFGATKVCLYHGKTFPYVRYRTDARKAVRYIWETNDPRHVSSSPLIRARFSAGGFCELVLQELARHYWPSHLLISDASHERVHVMLIPPTKEFMVAPSSSGNGEKPGRLDGIIKSRRHNTLLKTGALQDAIFQQFQIQK